jgi:hypothetical protein
MIFSISRLMAFCAAGLIVIAMGLTTLMQTQFNVLDAIGSEIERLGNALESTQKLRYESAQIQQFYTDASLTQDHEPMEEAQQHYAASLQLLEEIEKIVPSLSSRLQALRTPLDQLNSTGKLMVQAYASNKADGDKVMEDFDQRSAKVISELLLLVSHWTSCIVSSWMTVKPSAQKSRSPASSHGEPYF